MSETHARLSGRYSCGPFTGGILTSAQGFVLDGNLQKHYLNLRPAGGPWSFFSLTQVHGARILKTQPSQSGFQKLGEGDGLYTSQPGSILTMRTADCLCITLMNQSEAVLLHAGWRGLCRGIVEEGLRRIPNPVHVHLSAHIQAQSFEVGEDVIAEFGQRPHFNASRHIDPKGLRPVFNLRQYVLDLLHPLNPDFSEDPRCTLQTPELPSHRENQTSQRIGHVLIHGEGHGL